MLREGGGPSPNISCEPVQGWANAPASRPEKPEQLLISAKWEAHVTPASCQTPSASFPGCYLIWPTALEHSLAVLSLTLLSDWVLFLAQLWG